MNPDGGSVRVVLSSLSVVENEEADGAVEVAAVLPVLAREADATFKPFAAFLERDVLLFDVLVLRFVTVLPFAVFPFANLRPFGVNLYERRTIAISPSFCISLSLFERYRLTTESSGVSYLS